MLDFVNHIPNTIYDPKKKKITTSNKKLMKLIHRNQQEIKFEALFGALIPLGFALDTLTTFPWKYVSCTVGIVFSACCVSFALNAHRTEIRLPFVALDLINNFILIGIAWQAANNNSSIIFASLNLVEDILQTLNWFFSKKIYLDPWQIAVHEEADVDEKVWDDVPYNLVVTFVDASGFQKSPTRLEQYLARLLSLPGYLFVISASLFQFLIQLMVCGSYFKQVSVLQHRKFIRLLLLGRNLVSATLFIYVAYYYAYSIPYNTPTSCTDCLSDFCVFSTSNDGFQVCYLLYEIISVNNCPINGTFSFNLEYCKEVNDFVFNYTAVNCEGNLAINNFTTACLNLPIYDGYFLAICFATGFVTFLVLRFTIFHPDFKDFADHASHVPGNEEGHNIEHNGQHSTLPVEQEVSPTGSLPRANHGTYLFLPGMKATQIVKESTTELMSEKVTDGFKVNTSSPPSSPVPISTVVIQ